MASVANIVRFLPASGSTGDFVYSSGVTGYRTPVSSPALTDGATYRYRAESSDLSEWEIGEGTWTTSTTTLARTTIIHSSTGAKVNFTTAPNVAIVALADQFINPAGDTMTGALVVPNASGLKIKDTDASHTLGLVGGSNLTADRTLTVTTGDASRTLTMSADATISGTNTGDQTAASLGLGTGDSPQFTGVNIGHATDTTITRVSAGDIAVEGNTIYRAGGTDVALADGGTGASTAAGARANLSVRETLTDNRTYYVRTDGSDSNDGLTNTAGGAFLTLQKALDVTATIDFGGFTVTVQLADGTYSSTVATLRSTVGQAAASNLVIQGNSSTPSNVVLAHTTAWVAALTAVNKTSARVKDLKITTTTNAYDLRAVEGGYLEFSNIVFGGTGLAHLKAETNAEIKCVGNYTISGSAKIHIYSTLKGLIVAFGYTATFSGTPTISSVFAQATAGGLIHSQVMTWSGTVTSTQRYYAAVNGIIETYGAGANYFPGTAAGTTEIGGQYD